MKIFILCCLIAANANASTFDIESKDSAAEKFNRDAAEPTYFQNLVEAYNSTSRPATLSDFPIFPARYCFTVNEPSPNTIRRTNAVVVTKFITEPAPISATSTSVPASSEKVLAMGSPDSVYDGMNQETIAVFSNTKTATDLVVHVPEGNSQGVYAEIGGGIRTSLRRMDHQLFSRGEILFKVEKVINENLTLLKVGYCL